MSRNKHYDIERIIHNAEILSIPEAYECFIYECDDPDGFHEIEAELCEFASILPEGINILDLPNVLSGNKQTKVFGKGSCSSTNGHLIVNKDDSKRILFENEKAALSSGFRPCAKCLPEVYKEWKKRKEPKNDKY